jgi:hypothetical protein
MGPVAGDYQERVGAVENMEFQYHAGHLISMSYSCIGQSQSYPQGANNTNCRSF